MERVDAIRVAEVILNAPGWVRVGITAPTSHVREAAAHELARVILEDVGRNTKGTSGDHGVLILSPSSIQPSAIAASLARKLSRFSVPSSIIAPSDLSVLRAAMLYSSI